MASDFLHVRVQGQPELEKKLAGLKEALNTQAILDEGSAVLFARTRARFLAEVDPDGVKWPTSKAAIRRASIGRGGGTLFDTGRLFHSLQLYAESSDTRAIGTSVTNRLGFPYGVVHQFGSPRRMFLGFGEEDRKAMQDVVITRLTDELE